MDDKLGSHASKATGLSIGLPRVSASVQLGVLFAVATAAGSMLGFLFKHRGAVRAPEVVFKRPIYSTFVLFRSGWYTVGVVVALGSWFFHVAALALAPISLVQSVIAGGLVLLTVFADRLFGFTVSRREWAGVAMAAAGLAFLAATLEGVADHAHSDFEPAAIAAYIGAALAGGTVLAIWGVRGRSGLALGCSAGLMWAGSDIAIKGASASLGDGLALVGQPLVWVIIIASLVGLLISARSLQLGDPVPVIALTSVTANSVTIASGPIVFGDPLPADPLGLGLRLAAFALVIVAAALTPPRAPEPVPGG